MPLMPPKPMALSSTADDDEQSDEDPQKEEDEDDGHNETAEIDESGKGIQTLPIYYYRTKQIGAQWADYSSFC